MYLKEQIATTVKQRRKELGLEQVDLCEMADIGSTTLSKLEQGKANITLESLEKLLNVLGLVLTVDVQE
ncbi:MAG: helix-turn-helix domain-containing protein [Campylobacterota bacterium]|nr:helix-turn-helix domain-containing protein [Campylobacterota bacterium]